MSKDNDIYFPIGHSPLHLVLIPAMFTMDSRPNLVGIMI